MPNLLVSCAELAQHLDDPDWIVLDCQHDLVNHDLGRESYARGHIPGAHFVSMEADMAGVKTGRNGRHPLPTVEALERVFSRLGIGAGRQVVAYDNSQNNYAGRVWWTLRWLGHENVAVLDGGLGKWQAEGRALTAAVPVPTPAAFRARPAPGMQVAVDAIVDALGKPGMLVLDARAPERYSGAQETIDPVGGHIPGARLRFWKDNIRPDGTYKPAEQLRQEYLALLRDVPPSQVVHQCGSGVSACNNLIAMELAGLTGARLYVGSWSEWCADPVRPVATGAAP
ncbi:MAG: sulfurtransferase [Burkholderiales bacterium]|nr:sulfurtransferase [Burkholderiales bacterium]